MTEKQSHLDQSYPKCWCGNIARKGEQFCGSHMPDEEPPELLTRDDWLELVAAHRAEIEQLQHEIERLREQIYESIPRWKANELQREIERLQADLLKAEMQTEIAGLENIMRAVAAARREGIEEALRVCRAAAMSKIHGSTYHQVVTMLEDDIRALLREGAR